MDSGVDRPLEGSADAPREDKTSEDWSGFFVRIGAGLGGAAAICTGIGAFVESESSNVSIYARLATLIPLLAYVAAFWWWRKLQSSSLRWMSVAIYICGFVVMLGLLVYVEERREKRAEKQRRVQQQRAQKTAEKLRNAVNAASWKKVESLREQLKDFDARHPALRELRPAIQDGMKKLEEKRRVESVKATLDKVDDWNCPDNASASGFDTLRKYWRSLKRTDVDDSFYGEADDAVEELDRCRRALLEKAVEANCNSSAKGREGFVDNLDRRFLDRGMDVRMTLYGQCDSKVTLRWAWDRAVVHNLDKEMDLLSNLEELGFRRANFKSATETIYYTWDQPEKREQAVEAFAIDDLTESFDLDVAVDK